MAADLCKMSARLVSNSDGDDGSPGAIEGEAAMQHSQPWWKEPTRHQWAAFSAAWFGWVLDAFDFMIFLLVMTEIGREFGVSQVAVAFSVTLTLLARLPGGYLAGMMADRFGRRLPLMISIVGFSLCNGAIAIAPSFAVVLVVRTLFGLFMGAEWTAGTTLAMENWPARSRGIASGVLQGSWAIGALLAAPVHALVVPLWGWQGLFAVAAIPAICVLPIRFFVKESDEWKKSKATGERPPAFGALLKIPGWAPAIFWGTVVMACGLGAYYALTSHYVATITEQYDVGAALGGWKLFQVGMLTGAVICGWLAARRGVVLAVVSPAVLMIFALPLYVGAVEGMVYIGAFLGGMLGAGYSGVTPMLLTSLFTPDVRGRSVGIVYHLGALPASLVPPLIAALFERTSLSKAHSIGLVAGGLLLCLATSIIIAMAKLRPATSADRAPDDLALAD
jgi:MFS transporter, SHS family, lactate transporter